MDLTFLHHTHCEKMMYSSLLGFSMIHDEVSTLPSVWTSDVPWNVTACILSVLASVVQPCDECIHPTSHSNYCTSSHGYPCRHWLTAAVGMVSHTSIVCLYDSVSWGLCSSPWESPRSHLLAFGMIYWGLYLKQYSVCVLPNHPPSPTTPFLWWLPQ